MTLQGCDVRLSDRSAARNEITMCGAGHCEAAAHCRAEQDAARRLLIERILPRMDRVFVLNPELARDVPGAEFLPYACVDVAALGVTPPRTAGEITDAARPQRPGQEGHPLRPRRRRAARAAISHPLPEVSGLPHAEAMKLYSQADLVIDQVLAGWYGGFAVELMAMGKPVACYIRDEDLHFIPPAMAAQLPLLRVRPDTLEEDLRRVIALPHAVAGLGAAVAAVRPPLARSRADRPRHDRNLSQPHRAPPASPWNESSHHRRPPDSSAAPSAGDCSRRVGKSWPSTSPAPGTVPFDGVTSGPRLKASASRPSTFFASRSCCRRGSRPSSTWPSRRDIATSLKRPISSSA